MEDVDEKSEMQRWGLTDWGVRVRARGPRRLGVGVASRDETRMR